jgi:hypothetical protein
MLLVRDKFLLLFTLAPGVDPPEDEARIVVEGITPVDFNMPFTATRIELVGN